MKFIIAIVLLLPLAGVLAHPIPNQTDYDALWKKVEQLIKKELPKSALETTIDIYEKAKAEKNTPQFVRAVATKLFLQAQLEEDDINGLIADLRLELKTAVYPVKSILHSFLASAYRGYFESQYWKISQRTPIADGAGENVEQWTVQDFREAIRNETISSLEDKPLHIKLSSKSMIDLLEPYDINADLTYQPLLYDILVQKALDIFSGQAYYGYRDRETSNSDFSLTDLRGFLPAKEFIARPYSSTDSSNLFMMVKLYQDILDVHSTDISPQALAYHDLERLRMMQQNTENEERNTAYKNALITLATKYEGNNDVAPLVLKDLAMYYSATQDYINAIATANEATRKYPASPFVANFKNIVFDITEQRSFQTLSEKTVPPNKPMLARIDYQNIRQVKIRLYKIASAEPYEGEREEIFTFVEDRKAVAEFTTILPDYGDYKAHSAEIAIPPMAQRGKYLLLATYSDQLSSPEDIIGYSTYWVTDLTLITAHVYHTTNNNGTVKSSDYYVMNSTTGQPMNGVRVRLYSLDRVNYSDHTTSQTLLETVTSDIDGGVRFTVNKSIPSYVNVRLVLDHKDDHYESSDHLYPWYATETKPTPQRSVLLFTDRAIYRPGQTVYYKGILQQSTSGKADNAVMPKESIEVTFFDANNQKVSSHKTTANEFGSFNGTFTIPFGRLNGRMRIDAGIGNVFIRVEEYKRPKFEANFDPVKGSFKLGDTVVITGSAKAFSGASIDGAKVQYRVTRNTSFPYWRRWWIPAPSTSEKEIVNGSITTKSDGTFEIRFPATADPSVAKKDHPTFIFKASVDVTDINGETHSAETSVSIGYTSVVAEISGAGEKWKGSDIILKLTSKNMNGSPIESSGQLTIDKLAAPTLPTRSRFWGKTDTILLSRSEFGTLFPDLPYSQEEENVENWKKELSVLNKTISIDSTGSDSVSLHEMSAGVYLVRFIVDDPSGEKLTKTTVLTINDKASGAPANPKPLQILADKVRGEPGEEASFYIASAYSDAVIVYRTANRDGLLEEKVLPLDGTMKRFAIPLTESLRGGVRIQCCLVRNNRLYSESLTIEVPWSNKELSVKLGTFRSKLQPGEKDEWKMTITGSKGETFVSELLASMYDASLDEFAKHHWRGISLPSVPWLAMPTALNIGVTELLLYSFPAQYQRDAGYYIIPRSLNTFGIEHIFGSRYFKRKNGRSSGLDEFSGGDNLSLSPGLAADGTNGEKSVRMHNIELTDDAAGRTGALQANVSKLAVADLDITTSGTTTKKLDAVKARKNFNETAFFYPQLRTDEKGDLSFSFAIPEALTRWKMMGFAHTPDMRTGRIEQTIVTQKELMIEPNVPRFLHEGDTIVLKTKLTNLSEAAQNCTTKLYLYDASTMQPIESQASLIVSEQRISVDGGRSTFLEWNFVTPSGISGLAYKVVTVSKTFSDGEEAVIPVLPDRMLVTESLAMYVRGNSTKTFELANLTKATSTTLKHHKLTFELSSNPAWYAIQALPMLIDYPYECAEQIFNRFYANTIASHIVNSSPRIKQVFDSWKTSDALLSNLHKNEEVKQVLLQETPWVMQGANEAERKKRIALLFDLNTMSRNLSAAADKLREMQSPNGGWSWFKGMPESKYITQYIVAGFGHLRSLGVNKPDEDMRETLRRALLYLDAELQQTYAELKRRTKNNDKELAKDNIGASEFQYLYARSFFLDDEKISDGAQAAFAYYRGQAKKYWNGKGLMIQAQSALALHRLDEKAVPKEIIRSIKERSLHSDEMGMYWKQNRSWYWHEAPIETQAVLIEAFDEVTSDKKSVEEMKIWLLNQKRVQDWNTTIATADACYALLRRGSDMLSGADKLVDVTLGGVKLDPKSIDNVQIEQGTGYFSTSWNSGDIKPQMGEVMLTKSDAGFAWGGMYWQYYEKLDKIPQSSGNPLKISKQLFLSRTTDKGKHLEEITNTNTLAVGDLVTVRIVVNVDRAMEYVHLKDSRPACFEPVTTVSRYKYQGGLGYYESMKDASANFFMGWLPKGTYVLEYPLRVSQEGTFLSGISSIQCMYAPEFSAHTEGLTVRVK